jgi:hypothetical protein
MKIRLLYSILLVHLLFSCKEEEKSIHQNDLKDKTFVFYGNDTLLPFCVDFKDSTFINFKNEYNGPNEYPWKLVHNKNSNALILNDVTYEIKKNIEGFILQDIKTKKLIFKLLEEKPKWEKSQIIGEWIDERSFDVALPNEGSEKNEEISPAKYIIKKDSIYYQNLRHRTKSNYEISKSNHLILMKLKSKPFRNYSYLWEIEWLTDSSMTIKNKTLDHEQDKFEEKTLVLKRVK